MCSTRRKSGPARMRAMAASAAALGLAVALGGAAGCKTRQPLVMETHELVAVDEPMRYRDWPRSTAYFASGAVRTYRTRFPYTHQSIENNNRFAAVLLDFPALVYQTVRLPFTYLFYPPFSTRIEKGIQVEPTYTGVPPLRADPGGSAFGATGATAAGAGGAGSTGGTGGADAGGTGATGGTGAGGTGATGSGGTDAANTGAGNTGTDPGSVGGAPREGANGAGETPGDAPGTPAPSEPSPTDTPGGAGSGGTGTGTGGGTGTGSDPGSGSGAGGGIR